MRALGFYLALFLFLGAGVGLTNSATLPSGTVFKGRDEFDHLVQEARTNNWKSLRIGERTAAVGRMEYWTHDARRENSKQKFPGKLVENQGAKV